MTAIFPNILRLSRRVNAGLTLVGIKTEVGGIQYGHVREISGKTNAGRVFDELEAELRRKVGACAGRITAEAIAPEGVQVMGPRVVFKQA